MYRSRRVLSCWDSWEGGGDFTPGNLVVHRFWRQKIASGSGNSRSEGPEPADRGQDALRLGQHGPFERRRVADGRIQGTQAAHRRIQVLEQLVGDPCCDLRSEAVGARV